MHVGLSISRKRLEEPGDMTEVLSQEQDKNFPTRRIATGSGTLVASVSCARFRQNSGTSTLVTLWAEPPDSLPTATFFPFSSLASRTLSWFWASMCPDPGNESKLVEASYASAFPFVNDWSTGGSGTCTSQ